MLTVGLMGEPVIKNELWLSLTTPESKQGWGAHLKSYSFQVTGNRSFGRGSPGRGGREKTGIATNPLNLYKGLAGLPGLAEWRRERNKHLYFFGDKGESLLSLSHTFTCTVGNCSL